VPENEWWFEDEYGDTIYVRATDIGLEIDTGEMGDAGVLVFPEDMETFAKNVLAAIERVKEIRREAGK
jgi:hypothetical protein